jgi:Uma2 family endonuclease
MATHVHRTRSLVYDDLARFPDDGLRRELLEGVLYVTPSPTTLHQRVSKRLQRQLEDFFEPRGLGEVFDAPTDVILSARDVLVPDLVVATPGQIALRAIEGAPLLAIEILSPSSVDADRRRKPRRLAAFQAPHYWIVDLEARAIECYRLTGESHELVLRASGDETLRHPDWPELRVDLAALWR